MVEKATCNRTFTLYTRFTNTYKEYLTVPSLALRKQRIKLITLLVNHDMKEIDQNFYDYIAKNIEEQEHPYGVNWTDYDALSPKGTGVTTHE
ncbi:hypothetical protein LSPH26S_00073 [Lysinibacillus sphaericus]